MWTNSNSWNGRGRVRALNILKYLTRAVDNGLIRMKWNNNTLHMQHHTPFINGDILAYIRNTSTYRSSSTLCGLRTQWQTIFPHIFKQYPVMVIIRITNNTAYACICTTYVRACMWNTWHTLNARYTHLCILSKYKIHMGQVCW